MPKQAPKIASIERAVKVKEQSLKFANKTAAPGTPEWVKVFEKRHRDLVREITAR